MSTHNLYQIRDIIAETCLGPIIKAHRGGVAIRMFEDLLKSGEQTEVGKYPADYELISIGVQDDDTGSLTPHPIATVFSGRAWLEAQQARRAANDAALAAQNTNTNTAGQEGDRTNADTRTNAEPPRNVRLRQ